jgi:enterochelin esterase-like enzyme
MPHPFPNLPPQARGTVHSLRHTSEVLAGNPWGDPIERDVLVYTPPSWTRRESLPTITCLIGFSGTGEKLLARSMTGISIATRIDHLIQQGCPRFIAVLPDCMTSLGGSQYMDSIGIGAYGTYVADELTRFVDGQFDTTGRRGVMGHSSGGFGALHLPMNHPGRFHAAACHSGDMGFDLAYLGDASKAIRGVSAHGGLEGFVEAFWEKESVPGATFAALNLLCMACAYSPDLSANPIPARLPINFDTGEVNWAVLQSWAQHDPIHQAAEADKARALRELDWLFIDCGNRDEYNLQYGARRLVRVLESMQVPHDYEEFDGGHGGVRYRWDKSLRRLAERLVL